MSTIVASSLLEKLKEIQDKEGLSDYKFADKLGISHQLWQMTRTGKREIGLTILQGVRVVYPELDRDVLLFLSNNVDISPEERDITTITPETALGQKLGHFRQRIIVGVKAWFKRLSIHREIATKSKSGENDDS